MKNEIIRTLTNSFESYAHITEDIEYWLARDLQKLLDYSQWRNFEAVIEKAKESCKNSGNSISDHFADVSKTIELGKGATQKINKIGLVYEKL